MKYLDEISLEVGWKVEMGSLAESSAEEWTSCDALEKKKKALNEVFMAIRCFPL